MRRTKHFGRTASVAELGGWEQEIEKGGMSRAAVVSAFEHSREHELDVIRDTKNTWAAIRTPQELMG